MYICTYMINLSSLKIFLGMKHALICRTLTVSSVNNSCTSYKDKMSIQLDTSAKSCFILLILFCFLSTEELFYIPIEGFRMSGVLFVLERLNAGI